MSEPQKYDILIVDDNPKNLQLLGSTLREVDYNVEAALNGKEALEWMDEKAFDLVLLDVMMPEMDGFQVCEIIRQNNQLDNLPILFLTAKTDKESILVGFKTGAQDYITKPFETGELLARVKTHLELRRSKELLKETNQLLEERVAERTKELAEANAELLDLDDSKTEFLNIISHEIRTPLNGVLGFLNLLKERIDSDELKFYLKMLDETATRLEKFSLTALHITNLKVKKNLIDRREIFVDKLVSEVVGDMSDQLTRKGIDISFNSTGSHSISGDYELLSLCIMHILENSIHFSDPDSRIRIITESHNQEVICSVSDQGWGFSDDAMKKLFEMFSPGEPHIDSNKGLSLYLVKLIIDAHNGKIEVRNNADVGATVKLTFRRNVSN